MTISEEFPLADDESLSEDSHLGPASSSTSPPENTENASFWAQIGISELTEPILRVGLNIIALTAIIVAIWGFRKFFNQDALAELEIPQRAALAAQTSEILAGTDEGEALAFQQDNPENPLLLPALTPEVEYANGIPRYVLLHTTIPSRPRVDVITYTVQPGDTVFGIAETYGLRPETIFWGNRTVLNDDPHQLFEGQVLNILPVDGTYHQWSVGENLDRVADFYGVDPDAIILWPGNRD
jgi:hypothetical protein